MRRRSKKKNYLSSHQNMLLLAFLYVHLIIREGKKFGMAVNKWNEWLGKKFHPVCSGYEKKIIFLMLSSWIIENIFPSPFSVEYERKKLIKIFVAFVKHNTQPSHHRFLWQKFLSWIFKGKCFFFTVKIMKILKRTKRFFSTQRQSFPHVTLRSDLWQLH